MKLLLLLVGLVMAFSATIPTKSQFQNCVGLYCPFNLAYWNQTAQQAYAKFTSCVGDAKNPKCQNGYKLYNASSASTPLPQDFIDCNTGCDPKSSSNFYQELVYGCMIQCQSGVAPTANNLQKISDYKTCQNKCPSCNAKDIICITLQAQQFACQQKSGQCYFANQKYQSLKSNETMPLYEYSCYESCPPLTQNQTKLFTNYQSIYSCNEACFINGPTPVSYLPILKFGVVSLITLLSVVFI